VPLTLSDARSLLFAPGSEREKLDRALDSDADAVIADLEDSVVPSEKERARDVVLEAFGRADAGALRLVRVNCARTRYFADDLVAISSAAVDGIVLPKATADAVAAIAGDTPPIVAIVETAEGLAGARELAAAPGVVALLLGAVDLGRELGLEPRGDGLELIYPRAEIVLASALAGLRAPIDAVFTDVLDQHGLEEDARRGRALGMRGKACIHPAQIEVVNRVFAPSEQEIERAHAMVEAYEAAESTGRGAVAVDGELVDLPVLERARAVLAEASRRLDVE
jgi:citrate lyase subunit beta/citryl-CoA lyase